MASTNGRRFGSQNAMLQGAPYLLRNMTLCTRMDHQLWQNRLVLGWVALEHQTSQRIHQMGEGETVVVGLRVHGGRHGLPLLPLYDAGNAVYAGFLHSIFDQDEVKGMYNGNADPAAELMGDTLRLRSAS